jgi:pimeloyl-ACP methyl ester carboxylesterase
MSSQSVPAAIFTDPAADPLHPARTIGVHIPTHGVQLNGIIYQASGAGPHPTLVIFHGLPGNEKLLDLAQAVRRAGWNSVAFNYRGSWGSPGAFRFSQNLEDGEAVLAYLRDAANASQLGIDTRRIVLAGHSMGGWVVVHTAARDHHLMGAVLISAADVGKQGEMPRDRVLALLADCMGPLAGVTPENMADEMQALSRKFRFENAASNLTQMPLLLLTADDGFAPDSNALVHTIQELGGQDVTVIHASTDHNWSDHRIVLESIIINWLDRLDQQHGKNMGERPFSNSVPHQTSTAKQH